jgi:hypothetical protein
MLAPQGLQVPQSAKDVNRPYNDIAAQGQREPPYPAGTRGSANAKPVYFQVQQADHSVSRDYQKETIQRYTSGGFLLRTS